MWITSNKERRIREAVLLCFCDPLPEAAELVFRLSPRTWRPLLQWLDVSGLTLYFLDRCEQLGRCGDLPGDVLKRLQQNLRDNEERTCSMLEESLAIQHSFQESSVCYAVLKGPSLCPASVPRMELRHQFDLDYLVAEASSAQARRLMEERGYQLHAISGKSWEFKKNATRYVPLKDLYKKQPSHFVELHIEADNTDQSSRLSRVMFRDIGGMSMPVLSPVELFYGQGMHAFKDVCSAFSRAAHLLEFRRHVMNCYHDEAFWQQVRSAIGSNQRAVIGIGVVTCLIASIMGEFAPTALTCWTVDALPPSIRLWVETYGRRALFGGHPGTKLYLLLQKELEVAGIHSRRAVKASLLPSHMPPPVIRASSKETISRRVGRQLVQASHIASRLRFHVVEGAHYALESYRWRQQLERYSS